MERGLGLSSEQVDATCAALRDLHRVAPPPIREPRTSAPAPRAAAVDWELPIRIPAERADDLMAAMTEQEKMVAILEMIQGRMDAMLKPTKESKW